MTKEIKIKYFDEDMPKLDYIGGKEKSDWIDLRSAIDFQMKKEADIQRAEGV